MSENTPEASNEELELVSGGNVPITSLDYVKLQDHSSEMNQARDLASAMVKKMIDTKQSIIRNL